MKRIILSLLCSALLISTSTVFADPLATLETEEGKVNIVGFTTTEDDGKPIFVALLEYENLKNESKSPDFEYSVTAYQDGVELEHTYIYNFSLDGYKDDGTRVRPGSVLSYYELFELESNDPVDIEVAPIFNFDSVHAEYTFDLLDEIVPASTTAEETVNQDTSAASSVAQKISELEQKINELEQRIEVLESN